MYILEIIGIISFAISGAMVGIDRKADAFGVLLLAIITALGGGVIRDILLGHFPPRMFTSPRYLMLAIVCAVAVFLAALIKKEKYQANKQKLDAVDNVFDAAGLAAFTISGMDVTMAQYGMENAVLIITLGVITGVGGGVLRDVLTNAMPMVLYKHIYAVASMLGAILFYVLLGLGVDRLIAEVAAIGLIFALRMLATVYKWNLPRAES